MSRSIRDMYRDFKDGEHLSDDDTRVLHDHLKNVYNYCIDIPEYRIVANDAWNVYNRLADVINARAELAELLKGK